MNIYADFCCQSAVYGLWCLEGTAGHCHSSLHGPLLSSLLSPSSRAVVDGGGLASNPVELQAHYRHILCYVYTGPR